jgi:transposase-like protein
VKVRQRVGPDWRVDETYARVRGRWHSIYRAIDGRGQIVDVYVSPTRDTVAARTFFERARAPSGTTPRPVITDKGAAVPASRRRGGARRAPSNWPLSHQWHGTGPRVSPKNGCADGGLKSLASAAKFVAGHALMRNIRRGFCGPPSLFRSGWSLPGSATGWPKPCKPGGRLHGPVPSPSPSPASPPTPSQASREEPANGFRRAPRVR